MSEHGVLGLTLAAIFSRLDRLEKAAGITEPTSADAELTALIAEADPDG